MSRRLCTWCVAVVLPLSASAYVELFVVPDDGTHGIKYGELRWNMDETEFLFEFIGTSNQAGPAVRPLFDEVSTYFVYARFVDERPYAQIYGLELAAEWTPGLSLGRNLLYRQRQRHSPGQRWDRWDGDQPIPLIDAAAVAVTALGIQFYQPDDHNNGDLYTPQNGTALLGALELGSDLGEEAAFELGIGRLGLIVRDDIHDDPHRSYFPEVRLNGAVVQAEQYTTEGAPEFVDVAPAIRFVPEPAACVLLALVAAMTLRRR